MGAVEPQSTVSGQNSLAGVRVFVDDSENSVCLSGHSEEELAAAELKVKAQVEGLMMGLEIRQMEQWAEDGAIPLFHPRYGATVTRMYSHVIMESI